MKKSELKQIIKEEIHKLGENQDMEKDYMKSAIMDILTKYVVDDDPSANQAYIDAEESISPIADEITKVVLLKFR